MTQLTQNELKLFAQKILEDYDKKNPGTIFKDKINISNAEALSIQSEVSKLREKRGEEVIGYKIGCISKETQGKMGFTQPAY
jgi:2-keto-4-pentenoate hydratase